MSNGHTPGPWSFRGCDGGWAIDFNEDQEQVVDFVYEEADARLIAAAPDLLEALSELADLVDEILSGEYEPDSFTTQPARAAIAKAKGQ